MNNFIDKIILFSRIDVKRNTEKYFLGKIQNDVFNYRPVSSILSDNLLNGDGKRKRGRPRTLDGPEDTLGQSFPTPRISSVAGN